MRRDDAFGTITARTLSFDPRNLDTRAAAVSSDAATLEVPPDALVRVERPDGVSLYTRIDELLRHRGFEQFTAMSANRGTAAANFVVELLELSSLSGLTAELDAAAAVRLLEDRLEQYFGLWRLPQGDNAIVMPASWSRFAGEAGTPYAPALLLLNGLFSVPSHCFAALAGTEAWRALQRRYPGRILAHGAPTLSVSPISSAIELARALPVGAVLDIISHSRGGLVGELLAAPPAPLDADSLASLLARADEHGFGWRGAVLLLHDELTVLGALLRERRISVQHHLRAGTPLLGTPLAGRPLDRWLAFLLAAQDTAPTVAGDGSRGFLRRVVLEIIRRRGDASSLPGLAAMDPDAPLVRALALRGPVTVPTLAITGDVEGASLLGRVAIAAIDLHFGEPSDLVVPTGAMVSADFIPGAQGPEQRLELRDAGAHHLGYFAHASVRELLVHWPASQATGERGIAAFALGLTQPLLKGQLVDAPERPAVVVLPGFTGTSLRRFEPDGLHSRRIWPDANSIIGGHFVDLALGQGHDVRPEGPIDAYYGKLARGLDRDFDVHPMGYDWRASIPDTAASLATRIRREILQRNGARPVHLVAHSMGGVVAMTMLWNDPDLCEAMNATQSKLILLGVPTAGTIDPINLLLGHNSLLNLLVLADLKNTKGDFIEVLRSFPGLFQLTATGLVDRHDVLAKLGLRNEVKAAVREFWELRRAKLESGDMFPLPTYYVFGRARKTVAGCAFDEDGELAFDHSRDGDGTVMWASGRAGSLRGSWWIKAPHSQLAARIDPRAVIDILHNEKTSRLFEPPPEQMRFFDLRDEDRDAAIRRPAVGRLPSSADLLIAAMGEAPLEEVPDGPTRPVESADLRPPLAVTVVHGSLHTTSDVVVLGVCEGAPPGELALLLDRVTDGQILRLWRTGGWPIHTGAWCIVGDPCKPKALLVNLGRNGSLTRRTVVAHTTRALRGWLLAAAQAAGGCDPPAISAALVGSDGSNAMGPEEIAVAVVESVLRANRALARDAAPIHVRALSLCEPYRDLAARVAYALQRFADWASLDYDPRELAVAGEIRRTEGYYGARPGSSGTWDTWSTLTISSVLEAGALRLSVTTGDRLAARFRQRFRIPQALLDRLTRMAAAGSDDTREAAIVFAAGSTRDLRDLVRTGSGLLLQLDPRSAAIPWELLLRGGTEEDLEPRDAVLRVLQEERRITDMLPATDTTALVIGDPAPRELPALAGARYEAEGVRSRLRAGPGGAWTISGHDGADATEVLAWLGSGSYRILHLATHGRVIAGRSEVHLGGGYWEGAELLDRVAELPQFVFLNACHSGARMAEPAGFAASIARAFLKRGVQAIVVAGWAVDDAAARTFAETLYDHILDGETFGRSVRAARLRTRREHPQVNTWGAYQCYGNPLAVLVPEARLDRRLRRVPFCPGSDEAIDAIHSLHGDIRLLGPARRPELRAAVERHRLALPPQVAGAAEVQRKLAMLWLELGDIDAAAPLFKGVLDNIDNAQFGVVEWTADTLSRQAARARDEGEADKLFDRATGLLRAAQALRPERHSVLSVKAHHELRRGQYTEAKKTLQSARTRTAEAIAEKRRAGKIRADARFEVDALLIELALDDDDSNLAGALEESARDSELADTTRDTFTRRAVCDNVLLRYIASEHTDVASVGAEYRKVLQGSASQLWSDIVRDFLACIRRAARLGRATGLARARMLAAIDVILETLGADRGHPPPAAETGTPAAKHRVIVRHLRSGDASKILTILGDDVRRTHDAFTVAHAMPQQIREMAARTLIVEDLGPIDAHTPAQPTRGLTPLFRRGPEPQLTWPAEFRVEGDWPLVDDLVAAVDEAHGTVLARVGPSSVLARLPSAAAFDAVERSAGVRSVVRHGLAASGPFALAPHAVTRGDPTEPMTWDLTLSGPDDVARIGALVEKEQAKVVGHGRSIVRVVATAAQARDFAALTGVLEVSEYHAPQLANDRARALVGLGSSGVVVSSAPPVVPLDGKGELIAVADSGLDASHPDFTGAAPIFAGAAQSGDLVGHGTHVAGTIAASGASSKGELRGVAPGATLVIQQIAEVVGEKVVLRLPVSLGDLLDQAADLGAKIHNWSWGGYARGNYTADCVEVDTWLRAHPDQLLVVAAGNEGTTRTTGPERFAAPGFVEWSSITSPGTSKNALVVGASRSDRTKGGRAQVPYGIAFDAFPDPPTRDERISGKPEEMAAFSGRGPTASEQVRPDLVAPGTDVLSSLSTGTKDEYKVPWIDASRGAVYFSGTSMATPVVTGCAAIVRQYYRQIRGQQEPSAALLKATLIAGARWLTGVSATADHDVRPNIHQGFGRVDLAGTLPVDGDFSLAFIDTPWDTGLRSGQAREYTLQVAPGRPLRICMAYTDAPAKGIQNDLQLIVTLGDATFIGNEGLTRAGFSLAKTRFDRRNNVKIVDIAAPVAGEYHVQVSAGSLPFAPQAFALVALGAKLGELTDTRIKKGELAP